MEFPDQVLEKASRIRLISFDVDGVLTDGKLYYTDQGVEIKAFNVQDGSAIKLLHQNGIKTAIITGRDSPMVSRRASELGISHVYQQVEDKAHTLARLCADLGLAHVEAAHVGDDLPDLALFQAVGLAIGVPNGHPSALASTHYVTRLAGGQGVAREVCELILRARGLWTYG
jgi:3-deoxy-D-manno-octulosonate 8-phosphate phosphatase (KDO 8-P phosphatase)